MAEDLRFKKLETNVSVSRKLKRKKHLDEKKKKHKTGKVETHLEFPGREKVKFGLSCRSSTKAIIPKAHCCWVFDGWSIGNVDLRKKQITFLVDNSTMLILLT